MVPLDAWASAQWCCQAFQPHPSLLLAGSAGSFQPRPSTFAFSGHTYWQPVGPASCWHPLTGHPFGRAIEFGHHVGSSHPWHQRPSLCGSALGHRIRHFPTHAVVGQAFPLGFWCLIRILPDAFADWTIVPQLGQAWVNERTTSPFRTRNPLPQCPAT